MAAKINRIGHYISVIILKALGYTYSTGYVDFGNKTETMPTTLSATYAGRVQGYSINKNTANYGWVNGAANFEANFTPDQQTITGSFSDLEIIGGNYSGTDSLPDVTVTNGAITNGTFSGDLSVANTTLVSSSIEGSFYGDDAAEIGGIGQLETANTHTTFGFTAGKTAE
ncbi:MAG: transferrin-binding protein-like solute binding protein [Rhizobiales bacterium]|nr:transferrin-binding protein-like solute binding protein [Hyphomicrobiales bacterium]